MNDIVKDMQEKVGCGYISDLWHLALWVMKHIFQKINPNLLLLYSFFYLWGITFINF